MPKICLNEAREFITDVTVHYPNEKGGHDEIVAKVRYRIPAKDEKAPALIVEQMKQQVVDVVNLEDFAEFKKSERAETIAALVEDPCFAPALIQASKRRPQKRTPAHRFRPCDRQ